MKKPMKIALLVLAALTIAIVITAIVMLNAVSGDTLFYMNARLGSFYAVSYRWFCLASVLLIGMWVALVIRFRKEIAQKLSTFGRQDTTAKATTKAATTPGVPEGSSSAEEAFDTTVCGACGSEIPTSCKFCPFCGETTLHTSTQEGEDYE